MLQICYNYFFTKVHVIQTDEIKKEKIKKKKWMTKRENVKGNFYILPKSDSRHERLFFATAEQSAKSTCFSILLLICWNRFFGRCCLGFSGSRFSWLHFKTLSLSFRQKSPTYEFARFARLHSTENPPEWRRIFTVILRL